MSTDELAHAREEAAVLDQLLHAREEAAELDRQLASHKPEPSMEEAIRAGRKDIAEDLRTVGGGLVGAIPDITQVPSHIYHGYKGTQGPESYSDRLRRMIDEQTGGYTKPSAEKEDTIGHKLISLGSELVGGMGGIATLAGKGAKLAANALPRISKALRATAHGNKMNPKNLAITGSSTAGAMGASEFLPEQREMDSVWNVAYPMLGGIAGGIGVGLPAAKYFLPKHRKEAVKYSKWNQRFKIDAEKLRRDQELGIHGTLGQYSENPFLTMYEYRQRRHPTASKHYKAVDEQNIGRYEQLFGMDHPLFGELEPGTAGELLQKGAKKRQTKKEAEFTKRYGEIDKAIPEHTVIPGEMIQGKVGNHIFKDMKKLTPSEQQARLHELDSTKYLQRLGKSSKDLLLDNDSLNDIFYNHPKLSETLIESIKKQSPEDQAAILKHLGIESEAQAASRAPTLRQLEGDLGPTEYHSMKSVKSSLGKKLKKHFGEISDKDIGGNKHLFAQLGGVEDQFLSEYFPETYGLKKATDKSYTGYKQKEVPIINQLLGSAEKEVTPEMAFSIAKRKVSSNPNYISHAQQHLSPAENQILALAALKDTARKNATGNITPMSVATGYKKLSGKTQRIHKHGLGHDIAKNFDKAVDSIMAKKGLQALENTSGSGHYVEHANLLSRLGESLWALRKLNVMPAAHFLVEDTIIPKYGARKVFTNQEFLGKLNKHSGERNLKYADKIKNTTSFKNVLKNAVLRTATNPEAFKDHKKHKYVIHPDGVEKARD